jgi:molecular chaperone GrpE
MEQNATNPDFNSEKTENTAAMNNERTQVAEETSAESSKAENSENFQEKFNEVNDKYLRLYSEFDNYKKRTVKERVELIKTAGIEIITDMIPVLDDLERAIKSNEQLQDIDAIKDGIKLIHNKFLTTLNRKGLEAMQASGKEFDADYHEAITSISAGSEDLKGKVVDELEKGYLLNGKVIRYAKVIVGN